MAISSSSLGCRDAGCRSPRLADWSVWRWDRLPASFETAASRPPQDEEEVFMPLPRMRKNVYAIPNLPHPEERAQRASRRTQNRHATVDAMHIEGLVLP